MDAFIISEIIVNCDEMMPDIEDESRCVEGESLDSFLTERQIKVLQMRLSGLSQQEVAMRLGTTRSNISILEKRAHQNIDRAARTLQQWMMLRAPISFHARAGTDVFELPKGIFAEADKKGIRLPITSLDIIVQLRRRAPRLFKRRALEKDALIFVTEDGEVLVDGLVDGISEEL
ncbi:MAG: HTH-type transcriptional regulator, fmd operon transcriptional regulator [Euryarchaeota archaeon]|nr:HTH-type transcriptional regulator, fmd operon transcriptional regulator [Euryarchaeota archaeon]